MQKISTNNRQFIDLYVGGPDHLRGNATACYRELHAKASQRTCETASSRIMRKCEVQEYLSSKLDKISEETSINAQWVLDQAVELFKKCMGETAYPNKISSDGKEVEEMMRSFNPSGAIRALELIGKNVLVNAFQNRLEISNQPDLEEILSRRQKFVEDRAKNRMESGIKSE